MYSLYMRETASDLLVRVGRRYASEVTARTKAKAIHAFEVELRNDALPRARNLITIYLQGSETALH